MVSGPWERPRQSDLQLIWGCDRRLHEKLRPARSRSGSTLLEAGSSASLRRRPRRWWLSRPVRRSRHRIALLPGPSPGCSFLFFRHLALRACAALCIRVPRSACSAAAEPCACVCAPEGGATAQLDLSGALRHLARSNANLSLFLIGCMLAAAAAAWRSTLHKARRRSSLG